VLTALIVDDCFMVIVNLVEFKHVRALLEVASYYAVNFRRPFYVASFHYFPPCVASFHCSLLYVDSFCCKSRWVSQIT
jgi:hypothetical protein